MTLTNKGASSVSISNVTLSGAGLSIGGVSSGLILSAGSNATLNVTFAPSAAGTLNGSVIVTSNATNPTVTISLTGTAGQPTSHSVTLDLTPNSSNVTGYNVYITTTSFRSYLLPGRVALEDLARRAYEGLSSTNPDAAAQVTPVLQDLSRALIGPVAGQMTGRRLMVVAPGALQYVPFGALPLPGAGTPLIASHEIVNLPSASTLALMRRDLKDRPQASKLLAVLADPVFSAQDPRVQGSPKTNPASATFNRIPSTRKEAEQILALAPRGDNLRALDFDASRSTVMSGALRQYRFIHIASHGLLNTLHPELSGIALSLVDREGRPQNGFLEMHDVYNLSLGADLVVLSACETALGKEVKGEGLVGLSRGFMYAGAPRIVASLWAVPDLSTAELMTRFYRNMLVDGMRPAAALRQAQVSLWKDGHWARPYYWAAFTIEGEWR